MTYNSAQAHDLKTYLIHADNRERWDLIYDDHGRCYVERSGQRRKLRMTVEVFRNTEDFQLMVEGVSLAIARAEDEARKG